MNFGPLPDDWPDQRDTLHFLAAHVLGQARQRHDGMFDLVPSPAASPHRPSGRTASVFGSSADRCSSNAWRARRFGMPTATTTVAPIAGSSLAELCQQIGFEPRPDFRVGNDTPPFRDPDAPIQLDGQATSILGEWYLLGQRSIDEVVASLPHAEATVGRLWPEHFDYGIDLDAAPGVRCNLGAAAGDGFHAEPYLYVGPHGPERPGATDYWNAPFGAVIGFGELDAADDPIHAAVEFLMAGIFLLRSP